MDGWSEVGLESDQVSIVLQTAGGQRLPVCS